MNKLNTFFPGLLLLALGLALALSGCNTPQAKKPADPGAAGEIPARPLPPDKTIPPGPDFAEARPRVSARDELTATFSSGEVELDFRKSFLANEAQLFTALYEGLFSYHPFTMEPVPAIAEKWDVSADKKQWIFTLRQNAKFWNGDPLRAEDFRAAWISLLEPERNSPYSSLFDIIEGAREFRAGLERDPAKVGVSAPDGRTLIVKLISPASFFPAMLCHHSFSPIHPSMIDRERWGPAPNGAPDGAWEPPLSNGPFRISEAGENEIVMIKNEAYWDAQRVSLNKIICKFTETADEAANLWNSGEARWISGDVNLDTLTDRSGIQVNAMFATHYYFIRSAQKPWDDYRVRRALALALPWDEIRQRYSLPAETLIYPISGYPKVAGLSGTDLDEAKRLLAGAGFPGGAGLPLLVLRINPSEEAARIGGLMAGAWKENLGVPVKVEVVPYNKYLDALKDNNYTVASSTWIGDFADPYTFLQMWRRDSNLNDARHDDADYEQLIDKSMSEEGTARWTTLADAEKLLLERGSVLPISYSPAVNVVDINELDGWFPNALDIHPFKYLSFKAFRPLPGVAFINNLYRNE
jgi:peptide/nickel transport system substrate-binding protein/oligopeptide transport system substrate-binding protein